MPVIPKTSTNRKLNASKIRQRTSCCHRSVDGSLLVSVQRRNSTLFLHWGQFFEASIFCPKFTENIVKNFESIRHLSSSLYPVMLVISRKKSCSLFYFRQREREREANDRLFFHLFERSAFAALAFERDCDHLHLFSPQKGLLSSSNICCWIFCHFVCIFRTSSCTRTWRKNTGLYIRISLCIMHACTLNPFTLPASGMHCCFRMVHVKSACSWTLPSLLVEALRTSTNQHQSYVNTHM